jgi:hypothetical protein
MLRIGLRSSQGQLQDGDIDMVPLFRKLQALSPEMDMALALLTSAMSETADPYSCLEFAAVNKETIPWLFSQLVWTFGTGLDHVLAAHGQYATDDHLDLVASMEADVTVDKVKVLGGDRRHVAQELSKYHRAGQRAFQGAQYTSAAPDDAKVGHTPYTICPIANNVAGLCMWAPPQADSPRRPSNRGAHFL